MDSWSRLDSERSTGSPKNLLPGSTIHIPFHYDEFQYILDAKAEVSYTLYTTRHTILKKMTVEKGDCYIIPKGAEVTWKVDPSGPLKRLDVIMPAPQRYMRGSLRRPDGTVVDTAMG